MDLEQVRTAIDELLPETGRFLQDLIAIASAPGHEQEAMALLDQRFGQLGVQIEECVLHNTLLDDPDYSDPVPDLTYDGRHNLRVLQPGTGSGRTVLFNVHTDVVPPSEGMIDPWAGQIRDGVVYGRGACDDKGSIACLYLVHRVLGTLGIRLGGDVITHFVVEEENGGNGSLAMARRGETADVCIVMEPSNGAVFTSIRGAVWFRLEFHGKAGHSGQAGRTRSALLMARDAIAILEDYHARLLAESRGFPLFDPYPNPMPITFGRLLAGNWPASAPSHAVLEGVLGLLPNKTKEQVCEEMRQALADGGGDALADHVCLTFMYRHDSSVLEPEHELPQQLLTAGTHAAVPLHIDAMTASCDAWLYNNQLGIPTVVYGPGTLGVAHSKDENIKLSDIADAATVLLGFLSNYCGVDA